MFHYSKLNFNRHFEKKHSQPQSCATQIYFFRKSKQWYEPWQHASKECKRENTLFIMSSNLRSISVELFFYLSRWRDNHFINMSRHYAPGKRHTHVQAGILCSSMPQRREIFSLIFSTEFAGRLIFRARMDL